MTSWQSTSFLLFLQGGHDVAACSALFLAHVRLMGCQMFDTYKGFLDTLLNLVRFAHNWNNGMLEYRAQSEALRYWVKRNENN